MIFNKHKRHLFVHLVARSSNSLVAALIVLCAIINLPYILSHEIKKGEDETYKLVQSDFVKSVFGNLLANFVAFLRYFLLTSIFIFINLVILCASIKYAKRKRNLILTNQLIRSTFAIRNDDSGENSLTLLVSNSEQQSTKSSISNLEPIVLSKQQNTSNSSSEWNLTKMTLLIALNYFINMIIVAVSFVYPKLNHDDYSTSVILEVVASNSLQITNLFEIISYFLFNKFFVRDFKRLVSHSSCIYK